MDWYRLRHTVGMILTPTAIGRASYLKKHGIFYHMGDGCMTMFRKIPLYPKLISVGNNVWIASGVTFVTHDVIHHMLNNRYGEDIFSENAGCIEIKDNVFIGTNVTIISGVSIGKDTIVGAGSLVNKDLNGGVYAGVPAKYICSFEEYVEKRKSNPNIILEREKKRLSDKTVSECWRHFKKKHGMKAGIGKPERGKETK